MSQQPLTAEEVSEFEKYLPETEYSSETVMQALKKFAIAKEKELLRHMDSYKGQLADDPKVSATKFNNYQTAIYGCKCLVRDVFGSPRVRENAMVK